MPGSPHRTPLVSVLIPARNAASFIAESLDSVHAQGIDDLEVIVVDDGSSDSTRDVVAQYPGVRLICTAPMGIAHARNCALAASGGQFIAFNDADDLWQPGKLARQLDLFANYPDIDVVVSRTANFADDGGQLPAWANDMDPAALTLPAACFRRRAIERIGQFDESFGHCEDIDYFVRMLDAGVTMLRLDAVDTLRRVHAGNHTHQRLPAQQGLIRAFHGSLQRRSARASQGPAPDAATTTAEPTPA